MRKRTNRRALNIAQNLIIVCLIVSALALLLRTGLIRNDTLQAVFSTVSSSVSSPAGNDQSSIVLPLRIAAHTGGECRAWLNATTADEVFEDFGPILVEALDSAGSLSEVESEEFRLALENDSVYYDFTTTLSLSMLDQWLNGSGSSPRVSARSLLLSALQSDHVILYAWNAETDAYYRWDTAVPADSLSSTIEKQAGTTAEFAFLCGEPFTGLAPYTLICQEPVVMHDLTSSSGIPDEEIDALLTQLEFNVHSNARYTESNGTEVIVQPPQTLRIVPDGTIVYNGSTGNDIPLLTVKRSDDNATLAECTDAAWHLANALLSERLGDASLYLISVASDQDGNAEILLGYMADGIPIEFQEGYAVRIEIKANVITGFSLHLHSYALSDKSTTLLPVLQAAAAAQGAEQVELFSGYLDDGSDTLSPCWLRK